jgi:hypothetical protein
VLTFSLTSSSWNRRPPKKVFRCRNTWKSLSASSLLLHAQNLHYPQTVARSANRHARFRVSPISVPVNHSSHVLQRPPYTYKPTRLTLFADECQPLSCFLHSRTCLQTAFHGLLDFLEHCKHTGPHRTMRKRCRLSANGTRAFPKDQQTLYACTSSWPQPCSSNICKQNLFCGYVSKYYNQSSLLILMSELL